jgi:hypothetical protein
MTKILIFLILSIQIQASSLESYGNGRFNFFAKYPSNLFDDKYQSTNGDGITLKNKSKNIEVLFYGSLAVLNFNIKDEYKSHINYIKEDKNREITYKRIKRNWFILSGYDYSKRVIFYSKTYMINKEDNGDVFITYRIEYPIKDKKKYNYLIKLINSNFRP